ncbi:MAG: porin, partial [Planctomycetota bacterium]
MFRFTLIAVLMLVILPTAWAQVEPPAPEEPAPEEPAVEEPAVEEPEAVPLTEKEEVVEPEEGSDLDAAVEELLSEEGLKAGDTTLKFGGAIWVNYSAQQWKTDTPGKVRGMNFDNLRLSLDGDYKEKLYFSAQYRLYSYTRAIHHAYFGYQLDDENKFELGILQVPFGLQPYATHSFWFGLGYYVGLEDDYDAGLRWHHSGGGLSVDLAFFLNEEYNDATNLERYSVDVVRVGDQQNEEVNQFNARVAYDFSGDEDTTTEFGLSGRWGILDNLITDDTGDYWAAAAHFKGRYGAWNPELQVSRYEYHPENPVGVDDTTVLMGNLTSTRLVAAKGTLLNANLRRFFEVNEGVFDRFNVYVNYSWLAKDEDGFLDSHLINPGAVLEFGPFWVWIDFLFGKNCWYLNDSEAASGMGAG